MKQRRRYGLLAFFLMIALVLACGMNVFAARTTSKGSSTVTYGEKYYSAEDVAAYLHEYGELPENYITKNKAEDLGWVSRDGNLWDVAEGACIGGDKFSNREGTLPTVKGRKYYECDVNYDGGYRSTDRIIYSNDGYIYYTEDHYETFDLLYDEHGKCGEESSTENDKSSSDSKNSGVSVTYGKNYTSLEEVAAYLHEYEELPPNYITKNEAEDLGWVSREGNLWEVADGACIGGDHFSNRENKVPTAKGRKYYECDVNYEGGYRGTDRIIYSNDGLIYYTGDHYETFKLLYGDEN